MFAPDLYSWSAALSSTLPTSTSTFGESTVPPHDSLPCLCFQSCEDVFNTRWSLRSQVCTSKVTSASSYEPGAWYSPCTVSSRIIFNLVILVKIMTDWMKNNSSCNDKPFILKPVSWSIFDLLQKFKDEFGNNPRLRIHIDDNTKENVLVYEYFKSDLLSLIENYPALPIEARKTILKEVGLGLNDIHTKHWIHLGITPSRFGCHCP